MPGEELIGLEQGAGDEAITGAGAGEGAGEEELGVDLPADEGAGEGAGEGTGEGEGEQEQAAAGEPKGEVLPAALAKSLRELKGANPDHVPALNTLNKSWYRDRAFTQVFKTPDDARTAAETIEALEGTDGIAKMREEISGIRQFDEMASRGNPKVIESLADEFPDGFKKLIPVALSRLANMDRVAYGEAMRGPLLQELEGSGLVDNIGAALDEIKAGLTDKDNLGSYVNRVQRILTGIANWYNGVKNQETEYRNRYQDPQVKELENTRQELQDQKVGIVRTNILRDVTNYLTSTMDPEITKVLTGKNLSTSGRARFDGIVKTEVSSILKSNTHYQDTMRNFIRQGNVEGATRFAKPFIDRARKQAISTVFTDTYGTANAPAKKQAPANGQQQRPAGTLNIDKPIFVQKKPAHEEIDWKQDPTRTLFITGKAYLKTSGKFITWVQPTK